MSEICPVCERDNGPLVQDKGVGTDETFPMCRPCQQVSDIVEAAPIGVYPPRRPETLAQWMRRLQDELLDPR